jgi:hypothetical protein
MVFGRKLAMLIELSGATSRALVYADTDVLFISTDHIRTLLTEPIASPLYMTDPNRAAFDNRVDTSSLEPVNAGFLIIPAGMKWGEALKTCQEALRAPGWRTEQTVVSVAVNASGGLALPPERYVLRWDDRNRLRDRTGREVVLRHYVAPVRWRFWIRAYGGYWPAIRRSFLGIGRLIGNLVLGRARSMGP